MPEISDGPFANELWHNVLPRPVTLLLQGTAVLHVRYLTFALSKITKRAVTCADSLGAVS